MLPKFLFPRLHSRGRCLHWGDRLVDSTLIFLSNESGWRPLEYCFDRTMPSRPACAGAANQNTLCSTWRQRRWTASMERWATFS